MGVAVRKAECHSGDNPPKAHSLITAMRRRTSEKLSWRMLYEVTVEKQRGQNKPMHVWPWTGSFGFKDTMEVIARHHPVRCKSSREFPVLHWQLFISLVTSTLFLVKSKKKQIPGRRKPEEGMREECANCNQRRE